MSFFWIFFLFLLENSLTFFLSDSVPLLLMIGVIFYSLERGPSFGFWIGAWAGLLLEVFAGPRLGVWILGLGGLGFLVGLFASKVFAESLLNQMVLAILALFVWGLWERHFPYARMAATVLIYPLGFWFLSRVSSIRAKARWK